MSECVYEGMREVVRERDKAITYLFTYLFPDRFIYKFGEYSFIFYLSIHFYLLTSLFYFYFSQGNKFDRQRARHRTEKNKNNK